ncbi:MAG TPA: hypothetical protein VJ904_05910, partial [Tichowtungia sp.]|nr:hypothetical protein [Tichowtungia sp.]
MNQHELSRHWKKGPTIANRRGFSARLQKETKTTMAGSSSFTSLPSVKTSPTQGAKPTHSTPRTMTAAAPMRR